MTLGNKKKAIEYRNVKRYSTNYSQLVRFTTTKCDCQSTLALQHQVRPTRWWPQPT